MALPVPLAFLFAQPALADVRESGGSRTSLACSGHPPDAVSPVLGLPAEDPEARLVRIADAEALEGALRRLAPEYREVFLLREIEELSYKEIAEVAGVPIGTVMSRLSRARAQLRALVAGERRKETA